MNNTDSYIFNFEIIGDCYSVYRYMRTHIDHSLRRKRGEGVADCLYTYMIEMSIRIIRNTVVEVGGEKKKNDFPLLKCIFDYRSLL